MATKSPSQETQENVTGNTSTASNFSVSSTEITPSALKSEGRALLKKLDQNLDDVLAAEELYSLCLFCTYLPTFQ